MTRWIAVLAVGGILGGAGLIFHTLISTPSVRAQEGCTSASFTGAYGYTFRGSLDVDTFPILYAATGRLFSDGEGRFSGSETSSRNGEIDRRAYNGSYVVNPNCTGTAILNDNFGRVNNFDFVLQESGKSIELLQTDPATVVTGTLKPQ